MSPPPTSSPTLVPIGMWTVDPERSSARFAVKHLVVATVQGTFGTVAGVVHVTDQFVHAEGTVDVASVDTGDAVRDGRLRGEGFFDAERFPEIRFHATDARATGSGAWTVAGELTIGGCTSPLIFTATGGERDGAPVIHARGPLSRREHGLQWPGLLHSGRAVVGDEVALELELVLR